MKKFLSFVLTLFTVTLFSQAPWATFVLNDSICQGSTINLTANSATMSVSGYTWSTSPSGPLISSPSLSTTSIQFNNAGTYTVSLTAASGTNISYYTDTLVVLSNPTVTSSGPVNPICPPPTSQGPIDLYAYGANTYTWYPSVTTGSVLNLWPYPSVSTTYTVTGTDMYGCTNYTTQYVQVLPMPWVYASGPSVVCNGATNCFTAGGALWNYSWSGPCGFFYNGTAPCFSLSSGCGGTFTVGGVDGQCAGETTISIVVSPCTGINEMITESDFNIYPTPVTDKLTVETKDATDGSVEVELSDLSGRKILHELVTKDNSGRFSVDVSGLSPGIYFVSINSGGKQNKPVKIIKE